MPSIEQGYEEALKIASLHYENFPVISFLVPKELRKDIAIIYWFARTADDIADEGEISVQKRFDKLEAFEKRFSNTLAGIFSSNLDAALSSTIKNRTLTPSLFTDLISAFRQDITKKHYSDLHELLDYCRRSANPVGRLLLELYDIRDESAIRYSDSICSALQLTNFWQDVSLDIGKGRIYIPQNFIEEYDVPKNKIIALEESPELSGCIKELCEITDKMFENGEELLNYLPFRFRVEISWTIRGGRKILAKIKKNNYNVASKRVSLSKSDFLWILIKSLAI